MTPLQWESFSLDPADRPLDVTVRLHPLARYERLGFGAVWAFIGGASLYVGEGQGALALLAIPALLFAAYVLGRGVDQALTRLRLEIDESTVRVCAGGLRLSTIIEAPLSAYTTVRFRRLTAFLGKRRRVRYVVDLRHAEDRALNVIVAASDREKSVHQRMEAWARALGLPMLEETPKGMEDHPPPAPLAAAPPAPLVEEPSGACLPPVPKRADTPDGLVVLCGEGWVTVQIRKPALSARHLLHLGLPALLAVAAVLALDAQGVGLQVAQDILGARAVVAGQPLSTPGMLVMAAAWLWVAGVIVVAMLDRIRVRAVTLSEDDIRVHAVWPWGETLGRMVSRRRPLAVLPCGVWRPRLALRQDERTKTTVGGGLSADALAWLRDYIEPASARPPGHLSSD